MPNAVGSTIVDTYDSLLYKKHMKIKLTGFTDNTYKELKTIELENVMGISLNDTDRFLTVGYYENNKMKSGSFTSLQWAKGIEILPS